MNVPSTRSAILQSLCYNIIMHKSTFKYRLYPTKKQVKIMDQTLDECRWLYNHLLEDRKTAWEEYDQSISMYTQINSFVELKKIKPSLSTVHSQVLQNVAVRIDLAFKSFFRRVKAGEKEVGYPRFRGANWYDSFTYPQSGYSIKNKTIIVSKIGEIKAKIHRPIIGKIKTCCIRRTSTGKWFATLSCDIEGTPLPKSKEYVGIDVGLESFATLSIDKHISNPRFFRTDEKALAKAQRKMSKFEKGTSERRKARKVVSHIHERIANRRNNFAHQESRKIINQFGVIAVEDINTNRMLHNHCLAKSISDASWGQFIAYLAYKAENAGRKFVAVNPSYTSQDCSSCGHRQKIPLSTRTYVCPCCNLSINRDLNASLNILSIGLDTLGVVPRSLRL
jgi:putative transposase